MNTHPFERAGFRAPYTFRGAEILEYQACSGTPSQPAGQCDVCGTNYKYGAVFIDSVGTRFSTGLVCAEKSSREYGQTELADTLKNAKTRLERERRQEKARLVRQARQKEQEQQRAEEVDRITINIEQHAHELDQIAHPLKWCAAKGESWMDHIRYWLDKGMVAKAAQALVEGVEAVQSGQAEPRLQIPKVSPNAQHVSHVGAEVEIEGTVLARVPIDAQYGPTYIVKVVTDRGDLLSARTTARVLTRAVGSRVRFRATVKKHDYDRYQGCPVTWVTRTKVCSTW